VQQIVSSFAVLFFDLKVSRGKELVSQPSEDIEFFTPSWGKALFKKKI
jgi:hypothetical protein